MSDKAKNQAFIVAVDDYHEIPYIAESIRGQGKFKGHELGFDGQKYIGCVYKGRRPDDHAMLALLSEAKIKFPGE